MSAPVKDRSRTVGAVRTGSTTIPAQRRIQGRDKEPITKDKPPRGGAAAKAYARREERLRKIVGDRRPGWAAASPGRTPFVLLVMGLLAIGLVASLWLSTAAAADSYRLSDAKADARSLREQSERLQREVATLESAPEIARRAQQLGMVAMQDPPRLVVAPDGAVTVVGQPRAAIAPAPIAAPAPVAPAAPADPNTAAPPAEPMSAEAATQVDDATQGQAAPAGQNGQAQNGAQPGQAGQRGQTPAGQATPPASTPRGQGTGTG